MERPGALRAAPVLPEHVRGRVGLHAARALRSEARSHSIQGSSLHAEEEIQKNGVSDFVMYFIFARLPKWNVTFSQYVCARVYSTITSKCLNIFL